MYYSKEMLASESQAKPVKYDNRHALKDFDFLRLIDYRNVPIIKYIDGKTFDPAALAGGSTSPQLQGDKALFDFASAVITQLHYRSHIKTDEILREVNEFFHQSLIQEGYSLCSRPAEELRDAIQEPGIEVIIPGAQTRAIWRARVEAGIRMFNDLPFPNEINITFTGRCPEGGGRILNEAGDMILYFTEHKERVSHRVNIAIHREDKAQNTKQNLINSLARLKPAMTPGSHFFFISSLFHLPRLGQEVTTVLEKYPGIARQVTLVCPQPFMSKPEDSYSEAAYIKSAMFEFLQQLLTGRIRELPDTPGYG